MLQGTWKRHLDSPERRWVRNTYRNMKRSATVCGLNSSDPCSVLRSDRSYDVDNRYAKHVVGGPPTLTHHWIAFVHEHGRVPQTKAYYRKLADAEQKRRNQTRARARQRRTHRAQSSNSKEEADDDDDDNEKSDENEMTDADQLRNSVFCELSHVCGNHMCIVRSHIVCESKRCNLERRTCHGVIRAFVSNQRV